MENTESKTSDRTTTFRECVICTLDLKDNIVASRCGHIAHHECLFKWLDTSQTCPTCRRFLNKHEIIRLYADVDPNTIPKFNGYSNDPYHYRIYKDFTIADLKKGISRQINRKNKLDSDRTDAILNWLLEALKTYTSNDGMSRDRQKICSRMKQRLKGNFGGVWAATMGNFNSAVTSFNSNYIWIDLDNDEAIEIYRER